MTATTADTAVPAERHRAVRATVGLLVDGDPGGAVRELMVSVARQARWSGITPAPPLAPCDVAVPSKSSAREGAQRDRWHPAPAPGRTPVRGSGPTPTTHDHPEHDQLKGPHR